mgnify:CR=1 FL=1
MWEEIGGIYNKASALWENPHSTGTPIHAAGASFYPIQTTLVSPAMITKGFRLRRYPCCPCRALSLTQLH